MRFFLFIVFIAVIAAGAYEWERADFAAAGPAPKETVVLIAPGEHLAAISQMLTNAGAIRNPVFFRLGVRLRGQSGALKAGEYAIPAHASMANIMAILVSGKSIEHKLTAAEGLTSQMIYGIVTSDPVLTGDAGAVPAEGTLLPETYLFTRGVSRAGMLKRMADAQKTLLAKLWPERAKNLPFETQHDAIVLASVVEKESAIPEERRHIAAVFENRLRLGMKLQSDPTIIYGITKGYPLGRGIRESELNGATPYNTYVISGLPPTPICNPGKDSIAAVLNPENSKDLFFVADGTGGHVFSATIAEHEKNVAKWRKIEKASDPPKRVLPRKAQRG
jgi:peptidoglycan lytic transglycosylase G